MALPVGLAIAGIAVALARGPPEDLKGRGHLAPHDHDHQPRLAPASSGSYVDVRPRRSLRGRSDYDWSPRGGRERDGNVVARCRPGAAG